MPDWDNDEILAARIAQQGDARALETLFRRHLSATLSFAGRFLTAREDAEEAASECWLRAGRALRAGSFRGESRFKTWLLGIARRVCLERLRQPRLPTLSLSEIGDGGRQEWARGPASPHAVLDEALLSLTDDHRLVLVLCDLEGLTTQEAAPLLGRSPAAAKSLHGRARRALRDALLAVESEDA